MPTQKRRQSPGRLLGWLIAFFHWLVGCLVGLLGWFGWWIVVWMVHVAVGTLEGRSVAGLLDLLLCWLASCLRAGSAFCLVDWLLAGRLVTCWLFDWLLVVLVLVDGLLVDRLLGSLISAWLFRWLLVCWLRGWLRRWFGCSVCWLCWPLGWWRAGQHCLIVGWHQLLSGCKSLTSG